MIDVIHIPRAGKIEGSKFRLGSIVDGKLKLTTKRVPLGDGLDLASEMSAGGVVWLAVTAEAAKRLGWPHPANDKPKPDVNQLRRIVGNDAYGQQEQLDALRQISAVDPDLGRSLRAANAWLEAV